MLTYMYQSRFMHVNYILCWMKYRTFGWYINRKYAMYVLIDIYVLSSSSSIVIAIIYDGCAKKTSPKWNFYGLDVLVTEVTPNF